MKSIINQITLASGILMVAEGGFAVDHIYRQYWLAAWVYWILVIVFIFSIIYGDRLRDKEKQQEREQEWG